jgi:hypothetical protein
VFLSLLPNNTISIKIAYHVKLPYIEGTIDFSKTKMVNHGGIYNLIYGISKNDFTTYFQIKNNVIFCHRKLPGAPQFFRFKPYMSGYELIEFYNLNHSINGSESLLIRTDEGKWYIISDGVDYEAQKNCLALIDGTTGKNLFIASQDDNVLLKYLYPIADAIFPILQVTNNVIFLHLFDLSNGEHGSVSWSISEDVIPLLLSSLRRKFDINMFKDIKSDMNSLLLKECKILYIGYNNDIGCKMNQLNDIKCISIKLDFTLLGTKYKYKISNLGIKMSLKDNIIRFYMCIEYARFQFFKSKKAPKDSADGVLRDDRTSSLCLASREYIINTKLVNTYISSVIYKDNCLYIVHNNEGVRIPEKRDFVNGYAAYAVIYTYGQYLIIVTAGGYRDVKLIVLHSGSRSIGIWTIEDWIWGAISYMAVYNCHYDVLSNRLIFLSNNLECLFFIEVEKMKKALKVESNSECADELYRDIKELGSVFNLKKLILNSINEFHKPFEKMRNSRNKSKKVKNKSYEIEVDLLGYFIDEKLNKIYIIGQYELYEKVYIGLFVSPLEKQMKFKLVGLTTDRSIYVLKYTVNILTNASKGIDSLFKYNFYRLRKTIVKSLDICYDNNNTFVDFNYNRKSKKIVSQSIDYNIKIDFSWNIGNIIFIMYDCPDFAKRTLVKTSDIHKRFYCNRAYSFILADLNLVRSMLVVRV